MKDMNCTVQNVPISNKHIKPPDTHLCASITKNGKEAMATTYLKKSSFCHIVSIQKLSLCIVLLLVSATLTTSNASSCPPHSIINPSIPSWLKYSNTYPQSVFKSAHEWIDHVYYSNDCPYADWYYNDKYGNIMDNITCKDMGLLSQANESRYDAYVIDTFYLNASSITCIIFLCPSVHTSNMIKLDQNDERELVFTVPRESNDVVTIVRDLSGTIETDCKITRILISIDNSLTQREHYLYNIYKTNTLQPMGLISANYAISEYQIIACIDPGEYSVAMSLLCDVTNDSLDVNCSWDSNEIALEFDVEYGFDTCGDDIFPHKTNTVTIDDTSIKLENIIISTNTFIIGTEQTTGDTFLEIIDVIEWLAKYASLDFTDVHSAFGLFLTNIVALLFVIVGIKLYERSDLFDSDDDLPVDINFIVMFIVALQMSLICSFSIFLAYSQCFWSEINVSTSTEIFKIILQIIVPIIINVYCIIWFIWIRKGYVIQTKGGVRFCYVGWFVIQLFCIVITILIPIYDEVANTVFHENVMTTMYWLSLSFIFHFWLVWQTKKLSKTNAFCNLCYSTCYLFTFIISIIFLSFTIILPLIFEYKYHSINGILGSVDLSDIAQFQHGITYLIILFIIPLYSIIIVLLKVDRNLCFQAIIMVLMLGLSSTIVFTFDVIAPAFLIMSILPIPLIIILFFQIKQLKSFAEDIFTISVVTFDVITDINLIINWILHGDFLWAIFQILFIFIGQFQGARGTSQFEGDKLDELSKTEKCFSFFGFGRQYFIIRSWTDTSPNDRYKQMNQRLKAWELMFESFPSVGLQIYVFFVTNQYRASIVQSVIASILSMSWTVWGVWVFLISMSRIDIEKLESPGIELLVNKPPPPKTVQPITSQATSSQLQVAPIQRLSSAPQPIASIVATSIPQQQQSIKLKIQNTTTVSNKQQYYHKIGKQGGKINCFACWLTQNTIEMFVFAAICGGLFGSIKIYVPQAIAIGTVLLIIGICSGCGACFSIQWKPCNTTKTVKSYIKCFGCCWMTKGVIVWLIIAIIGIGLFAYNYKLINEISTIFGIILLIVCILICLGGCKSIHCKQPIDAVTIDCCKIMIQIISTSCKIICGTCVIIVAILFIIYGVGIIYSSMKYGVGYEYGVSSTTFGIIFLIIGVFCCCGSIACCCQQRRKRRKPSVIINPPVAQMVEAINATKKVSLSMVLNGEFDAVQQYINETNSTFTSWATVAIRNELNTEKHFDLSNVIIVIHGVKKGSIIIDYSLESKNVDALNVAINNVNTTTEIKADGNFTFPVLANTLITLDPTMSKIKATTNNDEMETGTKPVSKFQYIKENKGTYLNFYFFMLSDFYIRTYPIIGITVFTQNEFDAIYAILIFLFLIIFIGIFEFFMNKRMRI
eukprot:213846_1